MSITVIVGKPGAGKSLLTLQSYILPALLAGRSVYHNIPGLDYVKISYYLRNKYRRKDITPYAMDSLLCDYSFDNLLEHWKDLTGKTETPTEDDMGLFYLQAIPHAPSGSLVVLDEAQKKCYINVKNWQTQRNKDFFEYCTLHRKSKHEVLLVTQDDTNIDSSVNGIREELIFLFRRERLGCLFRNQVSRRYYLGHQTIHQTPYATDTLSYDKAMFGLYESYSTNDNKKEIRRTKNVFLNYKLLIFALASIYLFKFGLPINLHTVGKIVSLSGQSSSSLLLSSSSVYLSSSSFVFKPVMFLGPFVDYHCSDKIYVLRSNGAVDTIPPRVAPAELCPKFDYVYSREDHP